MQLFKSGQADVDAESRSEASLIGYIQCQLHLSVADQLAKSEAALRQYADYLKTIDPSEKSKRSPPKSSDWLKQWGAQVSMIVAVDEKSTLSPGINFNSPMANALSAFATGGTVTSAQSFTLGLGASVSSEAIREDTITFYYAFSDLLDYGSPSDLADKTLPDGTVKKACDNTGSGSSMDGDLGINSFLDQYGRLARNPDLLVKKVGANTESPYVTLTHHAKFIVVSSGSITPTWKLIRVTANPSGPFASAIRTRTDDLTITFGPATPSDKATNTPAKPSLDAQFQYFVEHD